jgi:hypothetical protein
MGQGGPRRRHQGGVGGKRASRPRRPLGLARRPGVRVAGEGRLTRLAPPPAGLTVTPD